MAIIQCFNCNRFYDDIKNTACPFCSGSVMPAYNVGTEEDSIRTLPLEDYDVPLNNTDDVKTEAFFDDVGSEDKTIGLFFQEEDYNPVTGWIVCVKGTVRGKSYELHLNKNFVGRNKLMDIPIPDDLQVNRDNHLSLTYDEKHNKFYAKSECGSLLVNGKLADAAVELAENDILEFGESKYIFVPFCTEERNWKHEE